MKPRKAPAPDPIENLECMVFALRTQLAFTEQQNAKLEYEITDLRRLLLRDDSNDPAIRPWLTTDEAADICCKTPQTIRWWARTKGIALPSPRGWKVIRSSLASYLRERGLKVPQALRD
jgi:Helix-turn-helix domain